MMPRNSSPLIEKEIICTYKIKLEKVLGVTVPSNAALATDINGIVAYPAGCTVVLFNSKTEQQNHIINVSRKTITSLAYSSCGRYLVTGECGHTPAVRVWDLLSDPQSGHPGLAPQPQQVAEFLGHKYGVNCVAFSPTNKYVVSVGTQHDMIVNVWDWKNNIKIASNKVSTKVKSIAFSENGSYFVTVGNRHVKFWFLEHGKAKYKVEAVPLMGRSAILGEQRNNYFCDVACGKGECGDSTYAITRSGLLCEFNNRRLLDKWVELRTTSANCITVGQNYIFVGCADGIVRCFDPTTLRFITTLPRCHYLGVDVSLGNNIQHMATPPQDAKYPDTIAISYDEINHKLTAVYNDHSIYIWDVFNIRRVGKSCSFLYHSACIWGVEMAPLNSPLPPGTFLTCGSDDTIRLWTLDKMNEKHLKGVYQPNIYSNDLLKVVYTDKDLSYIKDLDISGTQSNEKQTEQTSYDGKNGVRCIKVSPDGKHLASGDRSGNIRIHDTSTMREDLKIEAHDSEVLCLEYSSSDSPYNLLASASRDRLIHVFDTKNGYDFVQTLDDHSSSITAVRFLNHSNNIQMVSCGADKSLIFRSLGELNGQVQFNRDHNATGKTTLYDMEVDTGQKNILTACQDRNVRVYSVNNGKHTKTFKGSTGDDGTLIKVVLDRSGIYLATSCTDKSLSVYDYYSGECMATMCGHSELATGLRFTNDCRRLISASGDGCIFVWRVPQDMVITMHARLSQQAMRQGRTLEAEIFNNSTNFDFYEEKSTAETNYRFSIGQLPQWAKKQLTEDSSQPTSLGKSVAAPKGRWAQRAENTIGVQSFYASQPLPFPGPAEKRFDSDGSKDSSLDSGTEINKQYSDVRRQLTGTQKISPNITLRENRRGVMTDDSAIGDAESTAHDGDVDSDNDYRQRMLYYPSLTDSPTGNEFTVTNIDTEELRKSQRKKKATPQIVIQQPSLPYVSNDSDDDDDDASTPSGEATDRNPMSLFSVSSESLDQLVSRGSYLQATFESMSGAETELTPTNKSSFSSKFLTNSGNKNQEAINAVKQTKNDPEAIRKRQELNKRIAETKKKLESVGHSTPLKNSQSIYDLSHIPERDKYSKKQQGNNLKTTCSCLLDFATTNNFDPSNISTSTNDPTNNLAMTGSLPTNLQLCGCFMRDIAKNTSGLSHVFNLDSLDAEASKFRESLALAMKSPEKRLNDLVRPRKLQLDKTLIKYKMHKSLPVSPVTEERQFSDFVAQNKPPERQSFSYFVGLDSKSTEEGLKQICNDIEKFSKDVNTDYNALEHTFDTQIIEKPKKLEPRLLKPATALQDAQDEEHFSSDSLEDYDLFNLGSKNYKKSVPPRRCVSNNEIYKYQEEYLEEIPNSESFYLNPSVKNSQDSILSEENLEYDYCTGRTKSYCNSLESVISNESDCKSAPLEALFEVQRRQMHEASFNMCHSQSLPKNISTPFENDFSSSLPKNYTEPNFSSVCDNILITVPNIIKANQKTCQTQTDFDTPEQMVTKKARGSEDFQKKLLKFENSIAQSSNTSKKPVAFFVETRPVKISSGKSKENVSVKATNKKNNDDMKMYIPSLATKNKQYKSKFCNVLNNKPEMNVEIFETGGHNKNFTLSAINFDKNSNKNQRQETSSLDRHLFAKGLLNTVEEKITHKPPKAIRRHSSKRKSKTTYEYVKKDDFYKNNNPKPSNLNNIKQDLVVTDENTIELNFKENNIDFELQASSSGLSKNKQNVNNVNNNILTELYDSLDKKSPPSKMDFDSLDVNINNPNHSDSESVKFDSLELNVWSKKACVNKNSVFRLDKVFKKQALVCQGTNMSAGTEEQLDEKKSPTYAQDKIAIALENIKILNEIQRKLHKINTLVDIYKKNISRGKVRALSSMFENLTTSQSYYNDLTKLQATPIKFRRRNLSLPSFVERRLNNEHRNLTNNEGRKTSNLTIRQEEEKPRISSSVEQKDKSEVFELEDTSPENSLRRSCSLSDLSMQLNTPVVPKRKIESVSGKKPTRMTPRAVKNNSMMRSKSTMVLNQQHSDSENDRDPDRKSVNRLMRPTISSHNKINTPKSLQSRKKQSYSTSNLNQIGIDNISTSDDEIVETKKPQVPPRASRQLSFDNGTLSNGPSRKHSFSNKDKSRANRHTIHFGETTNLDDFEASSDSFDLSSIEFSNQLCEDVSRQLVTTADNVVKIYQRLKDNEEAGETNSEAMDCVKMSLIRTHKVVHDCIFNELKQNNGNVDVNQTDAIKKLNDLVSKGCSSTHSVIDLMQQYSDILLDMMQQKIHNANI